MATHPALVPFKVLWLVTVILILASDIHSTVLHVGPGGDYSNVQAAADQAGPGDTILIDGGTYGGGQYISNLEGTAQRWITIRAAEGETVTVSGGSQAWHLVDPSYVRIENITFTGQSANGVNVDDGGDYSTPANHVIFENCTWTDMNATGNNDQLKLSGLDNFEIRNCTFSNGSAGGSGVDMVGCHHGIIASSRFENQGSNCIQAKGGTQHIRIEGNLFKNGGQRSINLGGSTGLQFFRPLDAPFEAADLQVYSNVFIGSYSPFAYVGCVRVDVINNTIVNPENWVIRILQETVDPNRFLPCGDNSFRNNIIYYGDVSSECNVGANTSPETFTFSNNLWYNYQNPSRTPRNIAVEDVNSITGEDPLFSDATAEDFSLDSGSPAAGSGYDAEKPAHDFAGNRFPDESRSVGAFEVSPSVGAITQKQSTGSSSPFIVENGCMIIFPKAASESNPVTVSIYTVNGRLVMNKHVESGKRIVFKDLLPDGAYILGVGTLKEGRGSGLIIVR